MDSDLISIVFIVVGLVLLKFFFEKDIDVRSNNRNNNSYHGFNDLDTDD